MQILTLDTWKRYVNTVQTYLDETYEIEIGGIALINSFTKLQLPLGREIVDKFVQRSIPIITGGTLTKALKTDIDSWKEQAVQFGHASIIIYDDGRVRIPSPLTSFSQMGPFGDTLYYEEQINGILFGENEKLYWYPNNSDPKAPGKPVLDAQIFTIFYNQTNLSPLGQSRLSPSIRHMIKWASRIQFFIESVSHNQSHTQLIFDNVNADIMEAYNNKDSDPESLETLKKIKMGIHDALLLQASDGGEKTGVTTIAPTDPSGLIKVLERILSSIASAANLDPRDMGIIAPVQPSAEAQYAAKEDLVLEVKRFNMNCTRPVLAAIIAYAEVVDEVFPDLNWANPATPSESTLMAAFVQLASVLPAIKYSRVALLKYGIDPEIVDELLDRGEDLGNTFVIQEAQNEITS